ncbi:unnamed protein product [Rotaria sordida]|uniref:Uncharacterized protein n=1 Tax=Rotaria sordida TaxID=392033 RepID=A0A818TJ92_9BILA|nr:unnamed protein product [Rotaria sordida]CAF3678384.1 unnamed protein product [Rotaria sordida]
MTLALLPLDKVQITFDDLRTNSSENTRQMLHQLFLYFDNHWMKSIPLALWNAHGYNHRTNSICQDFHNRLNQCIQKSHPNIWSFIKCLQGEEARFRHMLLRINVGAQRRRKIVSTNAIQQRINTLNECYTNNEIDRNQLLDGLSLIVANDLLELCQQQENLEKISLLLYMILRYLEIENETKLFATNECQKTTSDFKAADSRNFIDEKFYKVSKLKELSNKCKIKAIFASKYHCELNPIEELWCNQKHHLCKANVLSHQKITNTNLN